MHTKNTRCATRISLPKNKTIQWNVTLRWKAKKEKSLPIFTQSCVVSCYFTHHLTRDIERESQNRNLEMRPINAMENFMHYILMA